MTTGIWTVDSFGHSLTSMYLMSKAGMSQYLSNRIDSVEKWLRRIEHKADFQWVFKKTVLLQNISQMVELEQKKAEFMEKVGVKVSVLLDHYRYPPDFFSTEYKGIMNPLKVEFKRQKLRILKILANIDHYADSSPNRSPFVPFGSDFGFVNARQNYMTIDTQLLFVNMNNGLGGYWEKVKAQYCDVKDYFEKIESQYGKKFGLGQNDDHDLQDTHIGDKLAKEQTYNLLTKAKPKSESMNKGKKIHLAKLLEKHEDEINKSFFKVQNPDFMPYTNRETVTLSSGGTWTGYYTTRTYHKRLYQVYSQQVREYCNLVLALVNPILELYELQNGDDSSKESKNPICNSKSGKASNQNGDPECPKVKKLAKPILSKRLLNNFLYYVNEAQWWVGILTHHDAITGTSTRQVSQNYKEKSMIYLNNLSHAITILVTHFQIESNGFLNSPLKAKAALLSEHFLAEDVNIFLSMSNHNKIYMFNTQTIQQNGYFELKFSFLKEGELKAVRRPVLGKNTGESEFFKSYTECKKMGLFNYHLCNQIIIIDQFQHDSLLTELDLIPLKEAADKADNIMEESALFESRVFGLGRGDVLVSFVSPEQTEIRIKTSNNFSVDVQWLRFEGKRSNL